MAQLDETVRWRYVRRMLEARGGMDGPQFQPSDSLLDAVREHARILVVGAGGLGCELLKDLALMGFRQLDVIDMDEIDLSNLNRQFLFREADVGQPKADVAAAYLHRRVPGVQVTPHHCRLEDKDASFYRQFMLVACGLDSVQARRWISAMLVSLLEFEEDELDPSSSIPMVDGGTEGFKGNVRVVLPGRSACVECTLDLYPKQVNYPLCTIAHTPRLPEHCVEWVRVLRWGQEAPFGANVPIDGDDPEHVAWIHEQAQAHAARFGIAGVTQRLTQGVVKRIIPAVASTNAVISAAIAAECFKLVTGLHEPLNNFSLFSDADSVYAYSYEAERRPDCLVCSQRPRGLRLAADTTLTQLLALLEDVDGEYRMRAPSVLLVGQDGALRTLYMRGAALEKALAGNLARPLAELGCCEGCVINVADATHPNTLQFVLAFGEAVQQ